MSRNTLGLEPREGIVYYLPTERYVGQTLRVDEWDNNVGRRKSHAKNGKNVADPVILYRGPKLDAYESYYIGYYNTLKPNGSNQNIGMDPENYRKGQTARG